MKKWLSLLIVLLAFTFSISADSTGGLKAIARIALLSDPHVNRATNGMNATFKAHFEAVIARVNAAKVDFVLVAGDLSQGGDAKELSDFKKQIKAFRAPVWFVPGNHDVGHKFNSGKEQGAVTVERVAAYEKIMTTSYFSHNRAGVQVIGINSSILGSGFEGEKKQWEFLEKQLGKPSRRPTILFMHYPMFLDKPDEKGGGYWNVEPEPRRRLLALIEGSGVKAVLTGHLHRQLVNEFEGILFVTTPPVSFGLPRGKQLEGWTLVTVPDEGEIKAEFQTIP